MVSARDAAPTLLCALLLALPLAACQEPASPAGNLVRQRADGSTRSLTARSSRAGTMTPALRAAYIRARQETAGPRFVVRRQAGQLTAANRGHRFDARFHGAGVRLLGRAWTTELRLRRLGRPGAMRPAPGGAPAAEGNRVTLPHGAAVREWYLNGPLGLEHGFTVDAPPAGGGDALALELEVTGDLHPRAGDDPRSLVLATAAGEAVLAYRDLFAHDANNRALDARMELRGRRVTLIVATRGAAFPVTVDPLITTETKLPSPVVDDYAKEDKFGAAVAVHNGTAVIGAPEAEDKTPATGAAYVFIKQGTTWRVQAMLLASDGAMWDFFGRAVAVHGDTVVVGSASDDDKGSASGSAYVFVRKGLAWSQQKKLVPADGAADDRFGTSVAVNGETVAVGAVRDDDKGSNSGSVYVYTRSGAAWSLQKKVVPADGGKDDTFGQSVALHKDTLAASSPADDDKGGNAGAVYVFTRSGTAWSQQQKLTAGDPAANDFFGSSVGLDGDTLVAGSPGEETTTWDSGAAYVFVRSGATWSQQQKLTAKLFGVFDNFGASVSVSGDVLVVGVPRDDVKLVDQGGAYVFVRSGTTWSQATFVSAADGKPADLYGGAVAVSSGEVLVGAEKKDIVKNDEGAVYSYTKSGASWTLLQKVLAQKPGGSGGDWLGLSVALDGDTAVVGCPRDDDKGADAGSAHVFFRGASGGWTYQQMLLASDAEFGDNFGFSVAVSGDTAVVGAPYDRASLISPRFGAAYVFVRKGSKWTQQFKSVGATIQAEFGLSVALQKDTLVVGEPNNNFKGAGAGAARVFARSGTKWTSQGSLYAATAAAGDRFGQAVAVDKDTAVVGAPKDDDKGKDAGAAYVFSRKGTSWSQAQLLLASDAAAGDQFGAALALRGQVAAVGAPRDDDKGTDSGAAYVFSRSGTTWAQQQKLVAADLTAGALFGSAASVHDDTAVVGAPGQASEAGAAYVYLRASTKWTMEKKITPSAVKAKALFGNAVALSGDTAIVGANGHDNPYTDMGAAYAYKVQRPKGVPCLSAKQCSSGHCVEGLCCDTACGGGKAGDCQACSVAQHAAKDGTCGPVKAGQLCRAGAGDCDAAETCTGASMTCPADAVQPSTHVCRKAAGGCDPVETCDGSTKACPADKLEPKGAVCRKVAGGCDEEEVCTGASAQCPGDTFKTKGTVCRKAAAGGCDAAETCTGAAAPCPADKPLPKGTVCRKGTAPCDHSETCDGATNNCPKDVISKKGDVCRKAAGGCDVAETCDGATTGCPPDKLALKGAACRKVAGLCDVEEACDGALAACPKDTVKAKGTSCRKSAGVCDVAEACDGAAAACPKDVLTVKGTVCRKAAGDCDAAEACDGAAAACPKDVYMLKGAVCRKAAGECDEAETCGGVTTTCPKDVFKVAGTKCLKGAGVCKAGKCDKIADLGADGGPEAGADATTDATKADKGKGADSKGQPDQGGGTEPEENGCSCEAGGRGGSPWAWALVLLGLVLARRRRG